MLLVTAVGVTTSAEVAKSLAHTSLSVGTLACTQPNLMKKRPVPCFASEIISCAYGDVISVEVDARLLFGYGSLILIIKVQSQLI